MSIKVNQSILSLFLVGTRQCTSFVPSEDLFQGQFIFGESSRLITEDVLDLSQVLQEIDSVGLWVINSAHFIVLIGHCSITANIGIVPNCCELYHHCQVKGEEDIVDQIETKDGLEGHI